MANELDQDPLVIDTTATDVKCPFIRALKFSGGGTAAIVDGTTGNRLWASNETCFDAIQLSIPTPFLIDVTVATGTLYIYKGSGPR